MGERDAGRFTVRCRECGRTVLAGVERVGDAEAAELHVHFAKCRPDLAAAVSAEFGALLARFDVRTLRVSPGSRRRSRGDAVAAWSRRLPADTLTRRRPSPPSPARGAATPPAPPRFGARAASRWEGVQRNQRRTLDVSGQAAMRRTPAGALDTRGSAACPPECRRGVTAPGRATEERGAGVGRRGCARSRVAARGSK